ncbi:MAG TPA: isocitrate lyase/phosphoenolpyruvate mutase family protein, partial [Chthonomonadales bacterium]|nr:isocitrate lyase/phosphoenolpyruvate mutase family protein [Chthonomonadales bacterium]
IFERAGFPAVATTSAGIANSLGYPDGQCAPRDEVLFVVRRIARTVKVPVTADIEAAYAVGSVARAVETVRLVLDAGAIGINIEDSIPPEGALVEPDRQCAAIQAIRALGDRVGIPVVINARTDVFSGAIPAVEGCAAEATRRARAYLDAGADSIFVPFVTEAPVIARLVESIPGPVNILAMPGTPSAGDLEKMGVARLSVGSGPNRATLALVKRIAEELRDAGTYNSFMEFTMPYAEANALFK